MGDAQKRASTKASIDRMSAYIAGDDFKEADVEDIEARLTRLESLMKTFDLEHAEIVRHTPDGDQEAIDLNTTLRDQTEDVYLKVKASFARKIKNMRNPPTVVTTPTPPGSPLVGNRNDDAASSSANQQGGHATTSSAANATQTTTTPQMNADGTENVAGASVLNPSATAFQPPNDLRITIDNAAQPQANQVDMQMARMYTGLELAPQELPKFNGDFVQWLTFRDMFTRLVDQERRFYPIAKFNALSRCLIGDAANVIAGIPPSDANYAMAWELVCTTYNQPRMIHNALMRMLQKLRPITSESVPALKFITSRFKVVVRQLEVMGKDVAACTEMLSYQLCQLLDPSTRRAWELHVANHERSWNINDLITWLERRANSLLLASDTMSSRPTTSSHIKSAVVKVNHVTKQARKGCPCCAGPHELDACSKFAEMPPYPRSQRIKTWRLCFLCLSSAHTVDKCLEPPCNYCDGGKKHHKLLCFKHCDDKKQQQQSHCNLTIEQLDIDREEGVLLGTAIVMLRASNGDFVQVRALLDTGSQANIISESCVQLLRLHRERSNMTITTVGGTNHVSTHGMVKLVVTSRDTNQTFQMQLSALVMSKVTGFCGGGNVRLDDWPTSITKGLADPEINRRNRIDLLLGANVWSRILMSSVYSSPNSNLVAQRTQLGWVVFGGLEAPSECTVGMVEAHQPTNAELNETLKKFWTMDAIEKPRFRSKEEELCEEIFVRHHERLDSGRFMVPIPMKPDAGELGESKRHALRALRSMEAKFKRGLQFKENYIKFMRKLIEDKIMTPIDKPIDESKQHFYLPHHGIQPLKKKFRVVFNGSAVTSSGESANSLQMIGEKLQDNLAETFLRFRVHRIALTGDVAQMYPQVLLKPEFRHYQLVLWRENEKQPIETFFINTVMFGMRHSLHSAVRAMQQCAIEGKKEYPMASEVVLNDCFVDDLITGEDDEGDTIELRQQTTNLLASGGFPIKKWASNSWSVLSAIDPEDLRSDGKPIEFIEDDAHSVLGVTWLPNSDVFKFIVSESSFSHVATKRTMASDTAKLYDPIGLISPITIHGRIMLRNLCVTGVDWDDKIPEQSLHEWQRFRSSLKDIEKLNIPRWIHTRKGQSFELHGFADASKNAYAAAIYYRVAKDGEVKCGLLTSKARVAPVKALSIPKLELSAATLTAKLMETFLKKLSIPCVVYFWSDSQIVIDWIKKESTTLKDFVANRVSAIQEISDKYKAKWRHVPTDSNPADIASRGRTAPELVNDWLWWNGPEWLKRDESEWPKPSRAPSAEESLVIQKEIRPLKVAVVTTDNWLLDTFESISRLNLVTAFVFRFVNNLKAAVELRKAGNPPTKPPIRQQAENVMEHVKPVHRIELNQAEAFWIKQTQSSAYAEELKFLREGKTIPRKSKLIALAPFIDNDGIIRVGGRLSNAMMSYDEKYPIIIPGNSQLGKKLIIQTHLCQLHGGVQVVTRQLRDKYWFIGGRNAIRIGIFDCVRCKIQRKQPGAQQMAPLVPSRVIGGEMFTVVSIDYAGPFEAKRWVDRCKTMVKIYVCVFRCMATRAIHLEVVYGLTTDDFIDAYQRFAARRGHCRKIISDNATTFVSAKRNMNEMLEVWKKCAHLSTFTARGIEWQFIMPVSPHQGGSHESAVKSFKARLKRVIKNEKLSVLQFISLVTRIEGSLNTCPLGRLSDDATDELALTPAHFLLGRAAETTPVDAVSETNRSLGTKFRHRQMLLQKFWKLWQSDYLKSLQARNKWVLPKDNMAVGDVVVLCDDNAPPNSWRLGQIHEVHPDAEGNVRNVTVRVKMPNNDQRSPQKWKDNYLQRAVQRVCKLLDADQTYEPAPAQDVSANIAN